MKVHPYILEPYKGMSTRYHCPACQKRERTFTRYIDAGTGDHVHHSVGRCNREINCGYHYTPKQYFQANGICNLQLNPSLHHNTMTNSLKPGKVSLIPYEIFKASLQAPEANHFTIFLIALFGIEVAKKLVCRYFIATSKHWNGATVFWQIDAQGKIRTGKIMLYDPATGKRVKQPYNHITWAHKALKLDGFDLKQCFFGEHLLIDRTRPVAIVESEKTAVIASAWLPEFIWLAAGSLTNLNAEKCQVLKGRYVVLFPDLKGCDKWKQKATELSHIAAFKVSGLLEKHASEHERHQGYDLADYLVKFDFRGLSFSEQKIKAPETKIPKSEMPTLCDPMPTAEHGKGHDWGSVSELEEFFSSCRLPDEPLKPTSHITIIDLSRFIEGHLAVIKANKGKRLILPYLNRLKELKLIINQTS